MPIFKSSDELQCIMLRLWVEIKNNESITKKLLQSKLTVQFNYKDPEGMLTVDASDGQELRVTWGTGENKPIIEMSMKADTAHEFWLGKVNVPVAILTGKMVSKGPTPKALALLPVIKPAFDLYPNVLKEFGKV